MRLLILFAALLLPVSAVAGEPSWLSTPSGSVTVIHPGPGYDYLYDDHRNTATIYDVMPGVRWYSAHDAHGKTTSQGYLFDPYPRSAPLSVPESLRSSPSPYPYEPGAGLYPLSR